MELQYTMSLECGAGRKIGLDAVGGDNGGDVFISSVDGVPTSSSHMTPIEHWIGGSGHGLVMKCRRCVGNPDRVCDLSTTTWTKLDPQS